MQEAGVDIAGQRGKDVAAFASERFDLVVTLADDAAAECPAFAAAVRRVHRPFDDVAFLEIAGEEDLDAYRALRDELRAFVVSLLAENAPPSA
jgi:arsenate reductase